MIALAAGPTISGLFTALEGVTSGIFGLVSDVAAAMIANPVLLIGLGVGFMGLAIGLFRKFV